MPAADCLHSVQYSWNSRRRQRQSVEGESNIPARKKKKRDNDNDNNPKRFFTPKKEEKKMYIAVTYLYGSIISKAVGMVSEIGSRANWEIT